MFSCVVQLCESTHNSSQSDRKSGAGEFMNSEHCLMLNLMITVCLEKGGPTNPISTQSLTPSNEWILQPYIQNASQLSKTLSSLCFSFFFFFTSFLSRSPLAVGLVLPTYSMTPLLDQQNGVNTEGNKRPECVQKKEAKPFISAALCSCSELTVTSLVTPLP